MTIRLEVTGPVQENLSFRLNAGPMQLDWQDSVCPRFAVEEQEACLTVWSAGYVLSSTYLSNETVRLDTDAVQQFGEWTVRVLRRRSASIREMVALLSQKARRRRMWKVVQKYVSILRKRADVALQEQRLSKIRDSVRNKSAQLRAEVAERRLDAIKDVAEEYKRRASEASERIEELKSVLIEYSENHQ